MREAVHHWLAAGDLPAAGDLVAGRWLSRYDDGRLLTARLWLDEFAPGQESAYAPLAVAGAWVKALSGQAVEASHRLGQLDPPALDAHSPDGTASLRSSAALVSAMLAGRSRSPCSSWPTWPGASNAKTGISLWPRLREPPR